MEKYAKIEKIGEGTYGVVYRGKHKATEELVALKKIRMDNEEEGVPSTALREVSLLLEAEHPNIVKLIEVIMNNGKLYLVFEYVNTDMRKWLDRLPQDSYLEEAHVKSLLHQILQAILFCHRRRIVHRDLKPQNVLISNDGRLAKVADFGLARAVGVPVRCLTHEVVTLWYRAPEVLLGAPRYSTPIDIWSVACIFVELATKQPLFRGDSEIDQLFRIFRVLGTPNDTVWPGVEALPQYKNTFPKWRAATDLSVHAPLRHAQREGLDLLAKMIAYEPAKRLNAHEALLHPYFQTGFDHSTLPAKWPEPSPIELWQRNRLEAAAKGPAGDRDDALRLVA